MDFEEVSIAGIALDAHMEKNKKQDQVTLSMCKPVE